MATVMHKLIVRNRQILSCVRTKLLLGFNQNAQTQGPASKNWQLGVFQPGIRDWPVCAQVAVSTHCTFF